LAGLERIVLLQVLQGEVNMAKKWIAVITRTDATFFSERPFARVSQLRNQLGREKNRTMTTDKPGIGRSRFSGSKGMHTIDYGPGPHEEAAIAFTKRIGDFLHKAFAQNRFRELTVIAEPKTLGRLKKEIDKNILDSAQFVRKDLGQLKMHEVADFLGLQRPRPRISGRTRLTVG
jgi:protein required for attachment to host cells